MSELGCKTDEEIVLEAIAQMTHEDPEQWRKSNCMAFHICALAVTIARLEEKNAFLKQEQQRILSRMNK